MKRYYCYRFWEYVEPDFKEMSFENDKEAIDFWLGVAGNNDLTTCFTLTRLEEIDGVVREIYVCMFKRTFFGLQILKSHAL